MSLQVAKRIANICFACVVAARQQKENKVTGYRIGKTENEENKTENKNQKRR